MSNESRFVANSIEELLVSLADGVREAQEALNDLPPLDDFGRPQNTYHLPFLDFEVEVEMQTVTVESGGTAMRKILVGPRASTTGTREISSKISGRLVAVPPGEGLPVARLIAASERTSLRKHAISVRAANSAGEVLAGKRVEFNIDMEASQRLSAAESVTLGQKKARTKLDVAEAVTDEQGQAATALTLDSREPAGASFVVTVNLGPTATSLIISV